MPGQLQAFQETCPPYPPNLWTLPAAWAYSCTKARQPLLLVQTADRCSARYVARNGRWPISAPSSRVERTSCVQHGSTDMQLALQ
jgi:hypothetical protein